MENYDTRDAVLLAELARGWELTRKLEQDVPTELRMLARSAVDALEKAMVLANQRNFNLPPLATVAATTDDDPSRYDGDVPKKRKITKKWTKQVRACSGQVLEGSIEDGRSWRKYGRKDILGAVYPRDYYRCTYRNAQGCPATRQVQRSNDDPMIFHVKYSGEHTCQQQQLETFKPSGCRYIPENFIDVTAPVDNPNAAHEIGSFSFLFNNHQLMATNLLPSSGASSQSSQPHLLSPCNVGRLGSATQSELSEMMSTANLPFDGLGFGLENVEFDASILDYSFLP